MEYEYSRDNITEDDYQNLLLKGYDYNQLGLDIIVFVLIYYYLFLIQLYQLYV